MKGNLMRNTIEMVMGAVVLLIAAAFFVAGGVYQ